IISRRPDRDFTLANTTIEVILRLASKTDKTHPWQSYCIQDRYPVQLLSCLLTREPQKYSVGYEVGSHSKAIIGKIDVLITDVINCDIQQLEEIIHSED